MGCVAAPKPADSVYQNLYEGKVYDGFAAEREQAPSPQKRLTADRFDGYRCVAIQINKPA